MKNALTMVTLAAIAAAMTGCTSSTRVEWGGKTAVRQPDGTVLVDDKGTPYYESGKNVYKDSNMLTKREERDLKVKANADGSYEAALGSRVNDVSENGIKMVTGGIEATTKLVSACAAAYATIAGGATADAATTVVSKMIGYFTGKGGNVENATVTADKENGTVKISDGSVCTTCTADGTCSDGSCNP